MCFYGQGQLGPRMRKHRRDPIALPETFPRRSSCRAASATEDLQLEFIAHPLLNLRIDNIRLSAGEVSEHALGCVVFDEGPRLVLIQLEAVKNCLRLNDARVHACVCVGGGCCVSLCDKIEISRVHIVFA